MIKNKKYKLSKKSRKNISIGTKKAMAKPEVRKKLKALKGNGNGFKKGHKSCNSGKTHFGKGHTPWNKGVKGLKPYMNLSGLIRKKGSENPSWRGGVTSKDKRLRHSLKYFIWQQEVYKKDNCICRICGSKKDIVAHHLKLFSGFPELRFDVNNGIVLCRSCHGKVHFGKIKII